MKILLVDDERTGIKIEKFHEWLDILNGMC